MSNTYPVSASVAAWGSSFLNEVQTNKTNMLPGLGAVTEQASAPPPPTANAMFLFGTA